MLLMAGLRSACVILITNLSYMYVIAIEIVQLGLL